MKLPKTTKISIRIITLFVTAIMLSVVPDYLHDFFNDEICNGTTFNLETGKREYFFHYGGKHHDIEIHWGYRHWLYFLMGLSLAVVQVVDISSIVNKEE